MPREYRGESEQPSEHVVPPSQEPERRGVRPTPDAVEAREHERTLRDDVREYLAARLRTGARAGRKALTALAIAEASLLVPDAQGERPEPPKTAPDAVRAPQEIPDRPMLSAEAAQFLREREGEVYFQWPNLDADMARHDVLNEQVETANALRFSERCPPVNLTVAYSEQASAPSVIFAQRAADQFGNRIRAVRRQYEGATERLFSVDLAPAFSDDAESRVYDVSVDLREFGGPLMERIAEARSLPLVASVGPEGAYRVHAATEEATEMQRAFAAHGEGVGRTVAGVEEAFGLEPGQVVQRIWIADTSEANAYAVQNATGERGIMAVSDEIFKDTAQSGTAEVANDAVQREVVVRHEALHLMDRYFRASDVLKDVFGGTSRETLSKLSEGNMLRGAWGGHAESDEREMFASVLNGVMDERWGEGTRTMTVAQLRETHTLLTTLELRLHDIPELKDAPIMARLRARVVALERDFKL